MKDNYKLMIIFLGSLVIIGWVFSTMISDVGISRVLPFLISMPIFILAILFAVFGKDLFRKQKSNREVKS